MEEDYLNYGGQPHHPDTSYSMNITATTTEPAADPGTGSGDPEEPEAPEIPSVMPEGAVLFRTATLSATGGWEYVFTDLPARNDDGTKLFVYYVKEIYPDGFSTSYIGNGSIGGSISIYNVRLREITVKKEWLDFNGIPLTEGLPESIDLVLTQYDDTAGTSREISVTLTADNGWQKKWRSNSAELNEQEGHGYRYRVTEVDISNEYTVTYSQNNQEGITEGTLIATNRRKVYPVSFVKADSTDHNITLSGAEFSIYSDPECMEEDIVEAYDSDSETAEIKTVFISGENGGFEIHGLRAGTYYLKELSAPEGYYLINYPLEVVITDEAGGVASVRGVRMVEGVLTDKLTERLGELKSLTESCSGKPCVVYREDGRPMDFCFMPVLQYGGYLKAEETDGFSATVDGFYEERDARERMRVKSHSLQKLLSNLIDRTSRKINKQRAELSQCGNREQLRICGDLLHANLYRIERGAEYADVENYYDENGAVMRIKLNPAISPAANAQRYYKEYQKAKTAETVLAEQIEKGQAELEYLESVADAVNRSDSERELSQIREELTEQGYLRQPRGKQQKLQKLPPKEYTTSDGFTVLVGRNNRQNDLLTLKTASKTDLWFHTKDIHGSHVILKTDGRQPGEKALLEAARLAAYHSKARESSNVPVDYTLVKYVSKPAGAKPGMVIYVNNKTLYVDPAADA